MQKRAHNETPERSAEYQPEPWTCDSPRRQQQTDMANDMKSTDVPTSKSSLMDDFRKLCFYLSLEVLRQLPFLWALRGLRLLGCLRYYVEPGAGRRAICWMDAALTTSTTQPIRRRTAREQVVNSLIKNFASDLMMIHDATEYSSLIEVEGWEHVQKAVEQGNGVVLLTTHVGIPRLLRWYLRTRDYRVCYLLKMGLPNTGKHSFRSRFGRWHRNRYRLDDDELFGQEEFSVQYLKKAYRHLKQNGLVNIAGDGSSGDQRIPVTICGKKTSFATGGLSLGLLSGAAVLPCFTTIGSSPQFRLVIQGPLQGNQGAGHQQQLESMLRDYVVRIEAYIRQNPANVFRPLYLSPETPVDLNDSRL